MIISDSTLSATIKIKQVDVGYLKSVSAKWVDKRIVISSSDLSDLPVGSYSLELWLSSSNGYEIYPDSGFVNLYINQNATSISGNLISSITLGEFQQQFSDLGEELMNRILDVKVGPQGEKGDTGQQGVQGIQGIQGERGEQGEQGPQGIQGVAGKDFSIAETFPSIVSMSGAGLTNGDFVMISSTVEDQDNAKMYLWNGTEFTFITDMSGATGIKGDTGEQGIQGVQGIKGDTGPQGIQGIQGETGPAGKDGINGTNGKDAVINVVTQAEYNALPDKTGVYFIGG